MTTQSKALLLKGATRLGAVLLTLWLPLSGAAPAVNQGPAANAGLPQFVSIGSTVRLDGSLSTSATGAPLTYQWSLVSVPSGSTATLAHPTAVNPTLVVDQAGTYIVQLAVSDGTTSSTTQAMISTQETPPVANAGPNQYVTSGSVVHLDGSRSSDPDGDSLTFQWSLVAVPLGSQTSISDPAAVAPTFFADLAGTYVAQLTVSDAHGNNSTSTVTVSTRKLPPIARAGQSESVTVGTAVQLDASASSDPDGDATAYSWSILSEPSGSTTSLSSAAIVNPTFVVDVAGTYVLQLAVSDGNGNVSLATVEITTDNIPPFANAGAAQSVAVGSMVQLDGSKSTGNAPLQYRWDLIAKPSGSTAAIAGGGSVTASFTADQPGQYLVQLQVSDGVFTSTPSTVLITAAAAGPNLVISPNPVSFGNQAVGTTSNAVGVTITNLGAATVQLTSFLLAGLNATEFTTRGLNPAALAPNSASIFSVFFTPQALGPRSATLIIYDSTGGIHVIALSGIGGNSSPAIQFSPTSLSFASQAVGTTSAPLPLTVTNTGNDTLQIAGLGFSGLNAGDFAFAANFIPPTAISPITVLANGGTISLPVVFTPTASGVRTAALLAMDNASGSPQSVALSGTGGSGQSAPISVTPASLGFPNQVVGSTSLPLPVTITNTGTTPAQITGLTFSGTNSAEFSTTATVPIPVVANGGTATIPVIFTPAATGTRTASLTITDNSGGSAHTVALSGSGTGAGPGISVSPASLNFGNQALNVTTSLPVTVTNNGGTAVNVTGMLLAGLNAGDFSLLGAQSFGLSAGGNATVTVRFTPQALGTRTATLLINNSVGTALVVSLSGVGGTSSPVIAFSPTSLSFGSQAVGTTSAPLPLTVTNTGNAALQITGLGFGGSNPGDFGWPTTFTVPTPASPITVTANGSAIIIPVVFKPTIAGQRAATLMVTDNASGSPQSVPLSGSGSSGPISVSPASLGFPNQVVGSTSSALPVTVTNASATAVQITSLTFSGANNTEFSTTATTPITVAGNGGTATIPVTFTPGATGTRTATLTITDSSGGSAHSVSLSGTGTAAPPGISVSPTSLNFGNQALNVTATLPVTISNTGGTTVSVSGMLLAGLNASNFNVLGMPSFTLLSGSSIGVNVQFTPPALGTYTATLIINTDITGTPPSVQLSGTGVTAEPAIAVTPNPLSFANQAVGTTSAPLSLTVANTGNATLQITALGFGGTNPGDFGIAANFILPTAASPITVAAKGSTAIPVVFKSAASGSRTATLLITDNANGSPHSVSLGGTATGPVVALNPTAVSFGNQNLNTISNPSSITLTNTGNAALQITGLTFGGTNPGDFAFASGFTVPTQISPIIVAASGGTATIPVVFQPTASGQRTATLQLTDNASNSPQSVTLSGNGVGPTVTFNPTSINFGSQVQNSASNPVPFVLTNSGNGDLQITGISISGANAVDFSLPQGFTPPTPATPITVVANGGTLNLSVTLTPSATGARTAAVSFADNAPNSPQTLPLTGNGITGPIFNVTPTSVNFGSQQDFQQSPATPLMVSNTGTANLAISSLAFVGGNPGDFAFSASFTPPTPNAPITVAPNGTLTVPVVFQPTLPGQRSTTLQFTDNASPSTQSIALSGTGIATPPTATLSASSLTFNPQPVNTTSLPLTITISNSGQTDLSVSSVSLSGTNPSDFQVSPAGSFTVTKNGGTTTLSITFTPSALNTRTATLSIVDNASNSPQTVSLSGTGTGQGQISLNSLSLGRNLEALAIGSVNAAPASDLTVTITSLQPKIVLVEPWQTDHSGTSPGPPSGSFTGTIAKGTLLTPAFWIQAVGSPGQQATVTITGNNYVSASATVTLTPSGFVLNNPTGTPGGNFTALLGGSPSPLTVTAVQLDSSYNVCTSGNPACGSTSQVLAGGLLANVTVTSGTTATGTITGIPAVVQPGSSTSSPVAFQPMATGQSTLSISYPINGFSPPNTETSLVATVMAPSITGVPVTVGFNMQISGTFQLNQAPSSPITVTVTSPDATQVLLSTDPTVAGTNVGGLSIVELSVGAGATSTQPFYIQAVAAPPGGVTLTAHANTGGYTDGTAAVALAPSAFLLSANGNNPSSFGAPLTTTNLSLPTTLTLALFQLNPATLLPSPGQQPGQLRPGISPLSVGVTSSNPSAGAIVNSPATLNGGDTYNTSLSFQPNQNCSAPCQTVLNVTQPNGFTTPANGQGSSLPVRVDQPAINLNVAGSIIGNNLEVRGEGALTAPAPTNLLVTIASDNPNVWLSQSPTAACTTAPSCQSITVTVPVSGGVTTFPSYYVQARGSSGTAHLTASAPPGSGFLSGTPAAVTLAPSGFVISAPGGPPFGGQVGFLLSSGSVNLTLQGYVLDATGMPLSGGAQLVSGGLAPSIAVTSDSAAAVVVNSPVVMVGGGTLADGITPGAVVTLQLQSTGVANITVGTPATPPGFSTPSSGNQLSVTIN